MNTPYGEQTNGGRESLRHRALFAATVAALVAALAFLWWARHVVLLAFAAFLLAVFFQTLADSLVRYARIRYGWALAVAVAGVAILTGLFGWLIGARVSQQFGLLSKELPESLNQLWLRLEGAGLISAFPKSVQQTGPAFIGELVAGAANVTGYIVQLLLDLVVVVFVGLYGAAQYRQYAVGVLRLVPLNRRPRVQEILAKTVDAVRWWSLGQLFAMVVIGVLTGVGLWTIGVRLPLALGVLAFMLEVVPYVGPFLSLVPAALLAWADSAWLVLWVLILFALIHTAEGYVITPLVQLRTVRLPPALHLLTLVLLAKLGGIWGVLVSAPMLVTAILLVRMLYVEDVLGDRGEMRE